ncbi:Pisatin demethylase [Fusarium albosuccineum]|uniref:Pisatin demethylase n=1 Tax=Fusarium albosuccineum TaxID=1237068 RepID=A0A8H4P7M8_9HYPO|nr:Pisatin demethylase [Fusarium albosuccineum]
MFLKLLAADYFWPLAAIIFTLSWYISSSVVSWYRLRHIPGPFLAKFSYLWAGSMAFTGRQYETHLELSRKYGSLVRVGPNEILTDDIDLLRRIHGVRSSYAKGPSYEGSRLNPYHNPMFSTTNPVEHDRIKTKLAPGYSGRETPGLEPAIDEQIENLVRLIRNKYVSNPGDFRPLVWSNVASLFTLDVISRIALGREFGCLSSDSDIHEFRNTLEEHLPLMSLTTDVPWLRRVAFSRTSLKLFGPSVNDSKGIGKLMKLCNDVVHERFQSNSEYKPDMLKGSFKLHGLTKQECETESMFMFVAGSDTAASVIRVAMLHILASPYIYWRLKQEIATAISEGNASKPITNSESKRLPYLQAVIYESLRIRSVSTNMSFKEVPAGGDSWDGKPLPAGTCIGTNFTSLLRSETMFGKDASVFRPERFLEVDEETSARMKRDVELTFGLGRWMCAGKHIAFIELNKLFFELFRVFEFQLAEPQMAMPSESYMMFRDKGPVLRVTEADVREFKHL